ncbi:hypothetical protein C2845_PM06G34420 [Panicum miliaceum]|uniref:Uncharacterized protein n=1 Tax=Panicum miliaceum TaxID=4540 RepID=A0A3L6R7A8_PANMI|nr:hypothetical protein C2845_PM06G34420 [Panicum miliaceum]
MVVDAGRDDACSEALSRGALLARSKDIMESFHNMLTLICSPSGEPLMRFGFTIAMEFTLHNLNAIINFRGAQPVFIPAVWEKWSDAKLVFRRLWKCMKDWIPPASNVFGGGYCPMVQLLGGSPQDPLGNRFLKKFK